MVESLQGLRLDVGGPLGPRSSSVGVRRPGENLATAWTRCSVTEQPQGGKRNPGSRRTTVLLDEAGLFSQVAEAAKAAREQRRASSAAAPQAERLSLPAPRASSK